MVEISLIPVTVITEFISTTGPDTISTTDPTTDPSTTSITATTSITDPPTTASNGQPAARPLMLTTGIIQILLVVFFIS